MFILFPLSFQALAPQEGGVKAEVTIIVSASPVYIISALSESELSWLTFCLIRIPLSIVCCDFFQRVRSEPDYKAPHPLPADVRPFGSFTVG